MDAPGGEMSCPLCADVLMIERKGDVEIDRCRGCGAVFFDAGELTQAQKGVDHLDEVGMRKAAARQDPADAAHTCPRCHANMVDVLVMDERANVLTDAEALVRACIGCAGLLLDAQALDRAQRYDGLRPYGQVRDKDDVGPGVRMLEKALGFLEGLLG
jgi:Zn-finger nucleic acid-binding protein